ncbi:CPBP family intramembrane glutamic endopeptidase [Diplocloster modestus]|uniref:CPBP family intramembrane metalloprotease n=1 Tax=Diplocloster modestus TaxID=2850322 RepID=A0ABS6KF35_9FIRM|nr:type II CAAX endopeptidase family protein [Diplocloster modestus]MBU9729136.1 CPBP family intramembrane metalloprotease [Diplocloster modestus]
MEKNKSGTRRRILIYLGLTFVITYLLEIFVIGSLVSNMQSSPAVSILVSAMMFIPAVCVLLTRLITKEGFRDAWILPNFRGHIRYYVIGWFLPVILTVLGSVVYFLIYPERFDPNLGYMMETYQAMGIDLPLEAIKTNMLVQIGIGVVLGPIVNIFTCIGEEWGWRGYLVPKLSERFRILPTLLISGVIWGLWHAPLTAMGHNYGFGYTGYPFTGILAMCGFCIIMGTLLSFLSLKTRSCLPAAIAHGSLNGFASIGIYFLTGSDVYNPFIGPAPTGIIGGSAFILTAVILVVIMMRHEKKNRLIAVAKERQSIGAPMP